MVPHPLPIGDGRQQCWALYCNPSSSDTRCNLERLREGGRERGANVTHEMSELHPQAHAEKCHWVLRKKILGAIEKNGRYMGR